MIQRVVPKLYTTIIVDETGVFSEVDTKPCKTEYKERHNLSKLKIFHTIKKLRKEKIPVTSVNIAKELNRPSYKIIELLRKYTNFKYLWKAKNRRREKCKFVYSLKPKGKRTLKRLYQRFSQGYEMDLMALFPRRYPYNDDMIEWGLAEGIITHLNQIPKRPQPRAVIQAQQVKKNHISLSNRKKPGDTIILKGQVFVIKDVLKTTIGTAINEVFQKEGFKSPNAFLNQWKKDHNITKYDPSWEVFHYTLISFEEKSLSKQQPIKKYNR